MRHPIAWTAPQPFWRSGAQAVGTDIRKPQILRFANDEFIEELLATLEQDPTSLPRFSAQAETWREPMVGAVTDPSLWLDREPRRLLPLIRRKNAQTALPALPQPKPLKLYQPAHLRHYLVAGSLICQTAGLPDRAVDPARQRVSFVLRRLFPKTDVAAGTPLPQPDQLADWDEYAWVMTGKSGEWQRVGDAAPEPPTAKPVAGEERLAMFPAKYAESNCHPRRLFVGSVPVGRRETYQGAQRRSVPRSDSEAASQARVVQFQADVLGPWRALVTRARDLAGNAPFTIYPASAFDKDTTLFKGNPVPYDPAYVDAPLLRQLRSQIQLTSWYVLLDLRKYLDRYLHDYLVYIDDPATHTLPAGLAEFHTALQRVVTPAALVDGSFRIHEGDSAPSEDLAIDLPDAIARIGAFETVLENALSGNENYAKTPFVIPDKSADMPGLWPNFLFLLVDPIHDVPPPVPDAPPMADIDYGCEKMQARIDALKDLLPLAALATDKAAPEPTIASLPPADMREAWYVMRLVFERPDCAPFEASVMSRATVPFQMAGFFDPDAPARPIRIGLPLDISPAGLRKFDKNAVFMMSDMLCGHLDRFRGITLGDLVLSVLPWPFHKDLSLPADKGPCRQGQDPLGTMCSLSIPIITICALILLIIIVSLLDFIFRWLPLFVVCFPIPGFKGKKEGS